MSEGYIEIEGMLVNVAAAPKTAGTIGKIVVEFMVKGEKTASKFSELVQMQGAPIKVKLEDIQLDAFEEAKKGNECEFEPEPGDRQSDLFDDQPENEQPDEPEQLTEPEQSDEPDESRLLTEHKNEEIEDAEFAHVEDEDNTFEPGTDDEVTDQDVEAWEKEKTSSNKNEDLPY